MAGVGEILPAAIGIAASPVAVIPAILLLFAPRARATSASFLAGWFVGVAVVTTVFVLLAEVVEAREYTPTWESWVRIVLGVGLVALGVRQWLTRGRKTAEPAWMSGLAGATPGSAFRLGLLLSVVNPKGLMLAAAGGLSIGADAPPVAAVVVGVAVFTIVASISVVVPVGAYLLAGERVLAPLGRARDWLKANNAAVMAVVLIVVGAVVVTTGATGL